MKVKTNTKPKIPNEAEAEIMAVLSRDMRISADALSAILKKHQVSGDTEALQDSYRRRVGQRLMASIRDENGKRELLASRSGGTEYLIVNCCNDAHALRAIRKRIGANIAGLNRSSTKVRSRIGFLERFVPTFKKKRKEQPYGTL